MHIVSYGVQRGHMCVDFDRQQRWLCMVSLGVVGLETSLGVNKRFLN